MGDWCTRTNPWLCTKLWYLHCTKALECISNGDTAVLCKALNILASMIIYWSKILGDTCVHPLSKTNTNYTFNNIWIKSKIQMFDSRKWKENWVDLLLMLPTRACWILSHPFMTNLMHSVILQAINPIIIMDWIAAEYNCACSALEVRLIQACKNVCLFKD